MQTLPAAISVTLGRKAASTGIEFPNGMHPAAMGKIPPEQALIQADAGQSISSGPSAKLINRFGLQWDHFSAGYGPVAEQRVPKLIVRVVSVLACLQLGGELQAALEDLPLIAITCLGNL